MIKIQVKVRMGKGWLDGNDGGNGNVLCGVQNRRNLDEFWPLFGSDKEFRTSYFMVEESRPQTSSRINEWKEENV